MDLFQHLGAAERYFSLCLGPTESKQDPNSDKGDIQRCLLLNCLWSWSGNRVRLGSGLG